MKLNVTVLFFWLIATGAFGQGTPYYQRQLRHGFGQNRGWIDDSLDAMRARIGVGGGLSQQQANGLYRLKYESAPITLTTGLMDSLAAIRQRINALGVAGGNGVSGADLLNAVANRVQFAPTITAMQALPNMSMGQVVTVLDLKRGGTFVYQPSGYVADGGIVFAASGGGYLVRQLANNIRTPEMYGAVGDSLTDDTQAVKLAIANASGGTVQFDRVYRVTTGQIVGVSNVRLYFTPGTGRIVTTSTTGNIISFSSQKNIVIDVGTFRGPNGNVKAFYASYVDNITFNYLTGYEVGLLRIENSSGLRMLKPVGKQVNAKTGPACIDISFFNNFDIESPSIDGYGFSIQWWDGDAAPLVNGLKTALARTAPHTSRGLKVHNATLRNSIAGFWGSRGEDIVLDGKNLLENFDDVGIDAEGAKNFTASGFTVRNAKRGGIAAFYNFDNVTFKDGLVEATIDSARTFVVHNNLNKDAGKLTLDNVTLRATARLLQDGYVDGSANELVVRNSTFENVQMDFTPVTGRSQVIENNRFINTRSDFPVSLRAGNVVPVGGQPAYFRLTGSKFINQYGIANGVTARALQVFHQNNPVDEVIENNVTTGYLQDVVLQPQTTTITANRATVIFNNNTFGSGFLFAAPPAGGNLALNVLTDDRNNRDGSGNFIGSNASAADVSTKAPVASPAFTGIPTAPTATTGTSTGQVATTQFVQQAVAGVQPNDSLVVISGSYAGALTTTKYAVTKKSSTTIAGGSTYSGYGARYQVNAPEWDTTGHNYVVINVSAATETALNNAISAVGSTAGRYLKLPAGQTLTVTNGVNIAGPINNMVIDLNSTTLACGTGRVGMVNIFSGNYRGLALVNTNSNPSWIRNTATTAQANALGNTGYGPVGIYEGANIQGQVFNGKFVTGLRFKNLKSTNPNLDYDAIFGNSYSASSVGGSGTGNLQRDIILEDHEFKDCGSAGYEHLFHRWDDGDTTTVDGRNLTSRRIIANNLGAASGKTPKFGPVISYSGRNEVSLIENVTVVNSNYSGVENVGGIDATIQNITSSVNTGNMTGISMTNGGKNYDLMRYVTIRNNSHTVTGSATGRALELFRVHNALVQNNTGVSASPTNFRVYNSLIGSLDGLGTTANNWRVTASGNAVTFQPGSFNSYFQYNDLSNVGSTTISEVVGLSRNNATNTTLNRVRYNTLRRGNTSALGVKYYNADGGADLTSAGENTNILTPNTLVP